MITIQNVNIPLLRQQLESLATVIDERRRDSECEGTTDTENLQGLEELISHILETAK